MADPVAYRETAEVEEWRVSDPIERFKAFARAEGLINDDEAAEIDADVAKTIEEAVQFALDSPEPDTDTLFDNIYS
jgi:pyruvate dehydrogenase E1 component alpha subunit